MSVIVNALFCFAVLVRQLLLYRCVAESIYVQATYLLVAEVLDIVDMSYSFQEVSSFETCPVSPTEDFVVCFSPFQQT